MLLQALYQYAKERNLLDDLPFQRRKVHLLIPLNADGSPRGVGFVPLTSPDEKNPEKARPGRVLLLPRYPGEKNNSRAQYLADPVNVVLGIDKKTLMPLPDGVMKKTPDAVKQFREFWGWLPTDTVIDSRLAALRVFRFREEFLENVRGWVEPRTKDKGKGKPEPHARLEDGTWQPLKNANTVGFQVAYLPLAVDDRTQDIWKDWERRFNVKFRAEVGFRPKGNKPTARRGKLAQTPTQAGPKASLCLVTGQVGVEVANRHKPEVKLPGAPGKGASFFSCGKAAFCSYGFKGGENASISIAAVASYALALEQLLSSDDTCIRFLTGRFCFWTAKKTKIVGNKFSLLGVGGTKAVADFLKEPFSGIDAPLVKAEQFMSVSLSANGGRVVVRDWIRVPLESAIENLANWFRHLAITPPSLESRGRPYRIHSFAAHALKRPVGKPSSQYKQRFDQLINELYRHAINGTAPPVHLLEPILAVFHSDLVTDSDNTNRSNRGRRAPGVFHSDLVTDSDNKPKYPFSQSRFALIKLILTRLILARNPSGGFMPKSYLAETDDPAYNLGRLLMVWSKLQKVAHKSGDGGKEDDGLKGPGIVERYYAAASSAPATTFPTLCNLHQHHLRMLEQKGEPGRKQADGFRNRIGDILALLKGIRSDGIPEFPRQLSLEEQGRFALGFYQQRTHDRIASLIGKLIREGKAKLSTDRAAALEIFNKAKRVAEQYGYPNLIDLVNCAYPA